MVSKIDYDGVELVLSRPDVIDLQWIGNDEVREQLLAAWLVIDPRDIPLNPRLIGKPGVGKTTLAYAVAHEAGREVYIMQCTMDTRPEDLIITPVIAGEGKIAYHASPLVTAMILGGTCVLDEGNRMSEKSWASLAPLLDQRRYVESVVAGIKINAHPDFRICVTMNDDASTYELPEYIQSRLQPQIEVAFPSRDEELAILELNVPFSDAETRAYVADFLQRAHGVNLPFSSRDGVNILRFAMKRGSLANQPPANYLPQSIEAVLGRDGADFLDTGIPANQRSSDLFEELMEEEDAYEEDYDDEDEPER